MKHSPFVYQEKEFVYSLWKLQIQGVSLRYLKINALILDKFCDKISFIQLLSDNSIFKIFRKMLKNELFMLIKLLSYLHLYLLLSLYYRIHLTSDERLLSPFSFNLINTLINRTSSFSLH